MSESGREATVADVLDRVRDRVTPTPEERSSLERIVDTVLERTRSAVADLPVDAEVLHLGSTARDTWLPGARDIDVFVRFPPSLDRPDLEQYGLEVGNDVLPDGHATFAEHPYVTGTIQGYAVDVVPCYSVEAATEIRSAVDRTPFHNAYLSERLAAADTTDIRVFKTFSRAAGVYGSDLRTRGVSGYLAELLVLEFGDVRATLETIAGWHPPVRLDPAGHGSREFEGPLVVVDPTDPDRNVAAVVSDESLARLQHHARAFLDQPTLAAFEPEDVQPIDRDAMEGHIRRRGTHPVAIRSTVEGIVDDQLYPQLRRSIRGLVSGLREHGFEVIRSGAYATPQAQSGDLGVRTVVLFVELASGDRPAIERHVGPPVHVREHAEAFLSTYESSPGDGQYGPFIDGDRYVVERERAIRTATEFLETRLDSIALGADIEDALEGGHDVLAGKEVGTLAEAFGAPLGRYFEPSP